MLSTLTFRLHALHLGFRVSGRLLMCVVRAVGLISLFRFSVVFYVYTLLSAEATVLVGLKTEKPPLRGLRSLLLVGRHFAGRGFFYLLMVIGQAAALRVSGRRTRLEIIRINGRLHLRVMILFSSNADAPMQIPPDLGGNRVGLVTVHATSLRAANLWPGLVRQLRRNPRAAHLGILSSTIDSRCNATRLLPGILLIYRLTALLRSTPFLLMSRRTKAMAHDPAMSCSG